MSPLAARVGRNPSLKTPASTFVILHFNDVYEIEARAREPVGGAARFASLLKRYAAEEPLLRDIDGGRFSACHFAETLDER